jgi:hypothetical protein
LRHLAGLTVQQLADLYVNDPAIQSVILDIIGNRQSAPLFWTHVLEQRFRNSNFSDIAHFARMGANLNAPIALFDRPLLYYPSRDGNVQAIRDMIANGANVNVQDRRGDTPLHYAVRSGNPEAIQTLINAGARSDMPNRVGRTAQDLMRSQNISLPSSNPADTSKSGDTTRSSCTIC